LSTFLLDWVDVNPNLCVDTAKQVANFPHVHLVAGGWYLDCSRGFVPKVEIFFYNTFVSSAPHVIELEGKPEEDNSAPPSKKKDIVPVKGKGRGKQILAHASSPVSICSYTKASVQRTTTPATTVIGSSTATPSDPLANLVAALSHNGATIPCVLRKRKVVAPDTSGTSSERSSCLSLIENVDIEELIEDLMKTKAPPLAYRRIQDFPTKVCMPFYCFIHSLHEIEHLIFLLSLHFFFSDWSRPYLSKHQT